MDCCTPPIPENREALDGYGNPKAKFQFTKIPSFMSAPRQVIGPDGKPTGKVTFDTDEQKAFIEQEILRCFYDGYWCYIKGQLTYFPCWYYFFLNYWRVPSAREDGRLEYRDSQRRVLLYLWNVLNFTQDFGVCYLKGRRNFATAIGHAIGFVEVSKGYKRHVGLSSSDESLSEENYSEMFAEPVKELPVWLTPIHDNLRNRFLLREPQGRKFGEQMISEALGGDVTVKALTKRGFDGRLIHFLFGDESGKWKRVNIVKWIARQIKTMMAMGKRIGFAWIPTTAEEIEEGGKEFRELFEKSDVKTLQDGKYPTTASKLRSLFIPAYDGWPGWIGPYGESIIDYPDDEQWDHMVANGLTERIGSKAMLERDVQQALDNGDDEGAALLKREAPFQPSDAWTGLNGNCPYETTILQPLKTITEQNMPNWLLEERVQRGYFEFLDKKTKTQPVFRRSDTGPVYIAWHPNRSTIGKTRIISGIKSPINDKIGILYLDTYSRTDTKEKGSNQGFGGKLFFNRMYEEENRRELQRTGKNMEGYHPTPSIFMYFANRNHLAGWDHEQVHAACLYFSMAVAIENNRSTAFEIYMNANGMRGFMLKEWEIKGEVPRPETHDRVGLFSGGETLKDGPISMGAQYHNEFLRGESGHLGEFNYNILEQPIRYPFPLGIQDNLDFDLTDREKSDYSMALNVGSYAEWNINKYDEYLGIAHGEKTKIKQGRLATYYRSVRKYA